MCKLSARCREVSSEEAAERVAAVEEVGAEDVLFPIGRRAQIREGTGGKT